MVTKYELLLVAMKQNLDFIVTNSHVFCMYSYVNMLCKEKNINKHKLV